MRRIIKNKPEGFTLFIVLIMMLVIAFIVIASMQSTNTEMRISSNDADRKFAFSKAEAALVSGETFISTHKHADFNQSGGTPTCNQGLCKGNVTEGREPVWKQNILVPGSSEAKCVNGASKTDNACYVVERLGPPLGGKAIYRVTARAWGQNSNTVVTLESYVEYKNNQ